ncbi:unnamed protein product [Diabrotica balteata]|uniref:Uncharacterized protein n=1 Tax=Diabrotica balteata TaxID=107213 RepID=A0A9N9TA96_DIABA|nr:unnamed protein product [Diabrotica balteata]
MMFDDRDHIMELAWRRIKKARDTESSDKCRIFKTPKINFSAKEYTDIIMLHECQDCQVTTPPVLRHIFTEDLHIMVKDKSLDIFDLPCHTQSVERCVKLITEISQNLTDDTSRDSFIRTRLEFRTEMQNLGLKNKFKF